ncbi:MAG TPA: DUF4129 domain-containing protein, partial [Candidatus Baltobacteraceae bacterium]|nr:DUF4129 domain-containing protein [Candidatus Baltobacteraceae bacterium]
RAAGDILVILGALVVAFAAARLLFAVQIARDRRVASTAFEPARRSAHAVARSAATAAESGNYTLAVRLLFAAAVALLDVRGVAHDRRSATINELCAAVRERYAGAEAPFSDIARIYTIAAYAEYTVDASAWERASSAYKRLAERASL